MVNKKEQVKKYLVKSVKKALKENVVTGGGAPAISNPVTTGGTGEAHQGGKKIRVKKNFKETFTKAITGNPRFAKNVKEIRTSSFNIPIEKLVSWASKNVLHANVPPYPEIQRYAEENDTTVENLEKMSKFYLSNIEMFGPRKGVYADVLKDLISNIKEITFTQNSIHDKPPLNSINEIRYGQFTKQNSTRTPRETLHKAIKEIHKRVKEVKKIMEFTSRMKTEFKDRYSAQYMERTNKALSSLQTELAELYKHFKQIK
jgi:DNA-directed RNA polymerase subunit L